MSASISHCSIQGFSYKRINMLDWMNKERNRDILCTSRDHMLLTTIASLKLSQGVRQALAAINYGAVTGAVCFLKRERADHFGTTDMIQSLITKSTSFQSSILWLAEWKKVDHLLHTKMAKWAITKAMRVMLRVIDFYPLIEVAGNIYYAFSIQGDQC